MTPGATVPADAVGLSLLQVSSSGLAVTLDPGGSEEHDVVVSNHTANLRLTIKLTATDATGSLGTGAAAWLAFGDDEIQLDPHAATTVPMTVAVPHDTQPGSDLAHVNANIESAVSAADGTPVAGTASQTFPVSIAVQGTPTAQIAIADVHRDDQGSRHELDVVLRNFGDQGTQVTGHVQIAGATPQILPFKADLAASRDTTVALKWNAPPTGTPSDIAVDLEYGGGNVASWSSRLGGPPTNLSSASSAATPATSAPASPASTTSGAAPAKTSKPWWKQLWVTVLAILLLLAAGLWFAFEMRRSRHPDRASQDAQRGPFPPGVFPPGWVAAPSQESIDLAKQLVKLTDVVVQLISAHRDERDVGDDEVRARSPGRDPAVGAWAQLAPTLFDGDPPDDARAGPTAPPDLGPPAEPPDIVEEQFAPEPPEPIAAEAPDPASPTPGAVARPDTFAYGEIDAPVASEPEAAVGDAFARTTEWITELLATDAALDGEVVDDTSDAADEQAGEDEAVIERPEAVVEDPQVAMMERLLELDRQRRHLRMWMDAEDSGAVIEPPVTRYAYSEDPDAGSPS